MTVAGKIQTDLKTTLGAKPAEKSFFFCFVWCNFHILLVTFPVNFAILRIDSHLGGQQRYILSIFQLYPV